MDQGLGTRLSCSVYFSLEVKGAWPEITLSDRSVLDKGRFSALTGDKPPAKLQLYATSVRVRRTTITISTCQFLAAKKKYFG